MGNSIINLKLLVNSQLASELGLITEDEKKTLLQAVEVLLNVMKRSKDKGLL